MPTTIINATVVGGWKKFGSNYPPSTGSNATSDQTVRRTHSTVFEVEVVLIQFPTSSLPDNAVISGVNLLGNTSATFNNEDNRTITGEWYGWNGVATEVNWVLDAPTVGPQIAFTNGAIVQSVGSWGYTLGNLDNISKVGPTSLRLHVSGGAPAGFNVMGINSPQLQVTYTVPNQPPVAAFRSFGTGLTRSFINDSYDPDGSIASYSWNFGDQSSADTTANPSHTFAPGTYTVTLTVTDNQGLASTPVSHTVVIDTPTAPAQPTWRNLTQFQVVPTNFAFEGNMPIYAIPFGQTSPDQNIAQIHLQIYRDDTGAAVYDTEFEPTPEEQAQGYFSRAPVTLDPLLTYKTKFRLKDNFNQYSIFSQEITFTVSVGPDPPVLTAPLGKINIDSGIYYQGTYSHPNALSANAVQVEVRDAGGSAILATTTLSVTIANGGTWSIGPDTAPWATRYAWRARAQDTAGAWSPWSLLRAFWTNSPPNVPTSLSPAEGAVTSSRLFACSVSDFDGDPITAAQIELVRVSTGAVVAGYPKQMTVASNGTSASFTAPTADMTLGTQYRYRCRATDGFPSGYGGWTNYVTFLYQVVPDVALLTPSGTQRRNLVEEPSAEYAESGYWTDLNETASDFIERIGDGDVDFGLYCWRGVASATSTNARRGAFHTVDATKPWLLQAGFKKESGTAASYLKLLCYDASDVLLGTLFPSSIAACFNADVARSWETYGGIVWPVGSATFPAFPSGTTKVQIEIVPSLNSAAVVRYDSVSFEQVPLYSAADWLVEQPFFGYMDGDAPSATVEDGYQWVGVIGSSESVGLNVLTVPSTPLVISYSSSGGFLKAQDRLTIESWDNDEQAWSLANTPTWASTARTVIPLPSGVVRNENRYRVLVEAQDTNGGIGSSGYVELDARYEGPSQLNILVATPNTARASIDLVFETPDLPSIEFGGVEIMVRATDGSESGVIVAFLGSVTSTAYSYLFPVSGKEYELSVRQIRNVGGDQVEGRWTRVRVACDYSPYSFLKNADNPEEFVAFRYLATTMPAPEHDALSASFMPLGSEEPIRFVGEMRSHTDTTLIPLFPDDAIALPEERYEVLKRIVKERPQVCLLTQFPEPEKVFVDIVGKVKMGKNPPTIKAVEFGWEKTFHTEDFYERNGT